uniref:Putative E3 ubiquitin-protein ligase ATL4 n=1 Tax=Davidia involucrata TaxID=16924 RepID=A0A5B7AA19_DAVIN
MASVYAPPPLLTIVGGTTTVTLPQVNHNDDNADESSSSSSSSSVMIVIIVIASAVIVSASLYLLLRYFSRRCHRSFRTFSVADDVVLSGNDSQRDRCFYGGRVSPDDLFNSLPLFTFGSVTGSITGGDCAVCLSKFERQDQLRLLPLCCHAFHAGCIDTWLLSNQTCPLCRSTIYPTESDVLSKILSSSAAEDRGNSFRIEIGSISRRRAASDSRDGRRSYSIGSFEYIVDDGYEVSVGSTHRRGISDCPSVDKDSTGVPAATRTEQVPEQPGQSLEAEITGGRSWLRDYVDRFASISLSSRALSFRSSGRFFTGSSRRSDAVVPVDDLEANRIGEEISELFRWFSGV